MKRFRTLVVWMVSLVVATAVLMAQEAGKTNGRARRIAIFGSSVANGTGDELGKEGYTGRLRALLAPRGWEVLNQSRGGDTTTRLAERFEPVGEPAPNTRYLMPVDPGYAVIALSLGNEGIKTNMKAEAERVYQQYIAGIKAMVERVRARNIVPIVTLVYTRDDFGTREYEYVQRANLEVNAWDVPSVNLLGAIDDGYGRWARGFYPDALHPNAAGHEEMLHAFVPSLFDALAAGKPMPTKSNANGFARVRNAAPGSPWTFDVQDTMRSFAVSFRVRTQGDGTVASMGGRTLNASREWRQYKQRNGMLEFEAYTLTPSGTRLDASVALQGGRWVYTSANGNAIVAGRNGADGQWHHVVLTHYVARGETLLYVDGQLVGSLPERVQPDRFSLGGSSSSAAPRRPAQADYEEWFIFRAGLTHDEVKALHDGKLLQASLELYAPLADERFAKGQTVANRAQSMSVARVGIDGIVHAQD